MAHAHNRIFLSTYLMMKSNVGPMAMVGHGHHACTPRCLYRTCVVQRRSDGRWMCHGHPKPACTTTGGLHQGACTPGLAPCTVRTSCNICKNNIINTTYLLILILTTIRCVAAHCISGPHQLRVRDGRPYGLSKNMTTSAPAMHDDDYEARRGGPFAFASPM